MPEPAGETKIPVISDYSQSVVIRSGVAVEPETLYMSVGRELAFVSGRAGDVVQLSNNAKADPTYVPCITVYKNGTTTDYLTSYTIVGDEDIITAYQYEA